MKRNLSIFAVIVALIPVLYVLSVGPVFAFYVSPSEPVAWPVRAQRWDTYQKIYAPVIWLCRNSPQIDSAVKLYKRLWLLSKY